MWHTVHHLAKWFLMLLGSNLLIACGESGSSCEDSHARYTVYVAALSRGEGVPEATRDAVNSVQASLDTLMAEGQLTMTRQRLGLEGEYRLTYAFSNERDGREAFPRIRVLLEGVDLIELRVDPCATSTSKGSSP